MRNSNNIQLSTAYRSLVWVQIKCSFTISMYICGENQRLRWGEKVPDDWDHCIWYKQATHTVLVLLKFTDPNWSRITESLKYVSPPQFFLALFDHYSLSYINSPCLFVYRSWQVETNLGISDLPYLWWGCLWISHSVSWTGSYKKTNISHFDNLIYAVASNNKLSDTKPSRTVTK